MSGSTCGWTDREDVFEGYLRNALGADERDAFEEHYFSCPACFDRLRTYRALGAELGGAAVEVQASAATDARPWRRVLIPAAVGLAIVAAVAVWRVGLAPDRPESIASVTPASPVPSAPSAPVGTTPTPEPAPAAAQAARRAPPTPAANQGGKPAPSPMVALSVLARVEAPAYIPVLLRGPRDEAVERFEAAMAKYVEGDYAGTIPGLQAAAELNPASAPTAFFLAACQLLTDQLQPAAVGFERAIALGESPYLEEAHFYLAKTMLRQGRVPAAREQLQQTAARRGRLEQEARRLLLQLGAPSADKNRPPEK